MGILIDWEGGIIKQKEKKKLFIYIERLQIKIPLRLSNEICAQYKCLRLFSYLEIRVDSAIVS